MKGKGEFLDMLGYVSKLGGNIPVHGIHMPTHGFVDDLRKCDYTLWMGMNSTILHGERYFREASKRVGPDGKILAIGHSAGAMNAHFAGMHLPEEIRAQIIVRAFAPAKIIERNFPFAGTQNFMSSNRDILMKYLKQVNGVEFENAIKSGLLRVLPAHPDASTFNDHRIKSPTFRDPIRTELLDFVKNYDCR